MKGFKKKLNENSVNNLDKGIRDSSKVLMMDYFIQYNYLEKRRNSREKNLKKRCKGKDKLSCRRRILNGFVMDL